MTVPSCPSCGHPTSGETGFCGECGAVLPSVPPSVAPTTVTPAVAPPPPPTPAPPAPTNQTPWFIAGAAVIVVLLAVLLVLLLRSDDRSDEPVTAVTAATSTTSSSTSTSSTTAPAPAPAPAAPSPTPTNETGFATGLFCRDLNALGVSYVDAVDYWIVEGAPDRMDADLDGVPCETVYPLADIIDYWGFDPSIPGATLRSGLFCRDLDDLGLSYASAVDYWIDEGAPDRMDADLDGVPCETVYPLADIIDYWGFDPS